MSSPSLPAGTFAASSSSCASGWGPRSGASASPAQRSTAPPLLIAPPTIQRPGTSA